MPASLTSFIGREREVSEAKLFLSHTRLLTLSGAGGVGKTRLALEVARDLIGAYPDGVWLAELASLSEPDLVPQAIAAALGVREQPGRSLTDTLTDALHAKEMLLVLDKSLDDPSRHTPEADIYTKRAQPWDRMNPELPKFAELPPLPDSPLFEIQQS